MSLSHEANAAQGIAVPHFSFPKWAAPALLALGATVAALIIAQDLHTTDEAGWSESDQEVWGRCGFSPTGYHILAPHILYFESGQLISKNYRCKFFDECGFSLPG
ncbi:MAG: hypothetical protein AAB439_00195 [Patescibacteria group bacterium]